MSRALISVSDKTGIAEFARGLQKQNFEIISTGGTAKALEEEGIEVTPVEAITEFPECFSGRVKTMHPKILGGVLFRRGDSEHEEQAKELGIEPIDMVVINLYPFEEEQAIEQIDVGGPTLLRSAAKNFASVTAVCDPADYDRVLKEIEEKGETSEALRKELAGKVFTRTATYDSAIMKWMTEEGSRTCTLVDGFDLRYGENPHQKGSYYDAYGMGRPWKILQEEKPFDSAQGKRLSYLNVLDADGAWNLVKEFAEPTAACIKHANPSGVASHSDISEAFQRCYDADKLSAFGVIIALNRECPKEVIEKIIEQKIFTEVIIAPGFASDAIELLKEKPKIRAIEMDPERKVLSVTMRNALGGILVQGEDVQVVTEKNLNVVTSAKPSDEQIADLLFAWKVVKHSKSNAIVFAKDLVTVGIGCGQTSRVDSTWIAAKRAGERAGGAVMASDAFFPFPDSVEEAAKHGITAIIQPGGSIRDEEVFAKAEELGIAMVTTGVRAFRH